MEGREERQILERLHQEVEGRRVQSPHIPPLWPPNAPQSGTDWAVVTELLRRSESLAVGDTGPAARSVLSRLRAKIRRLWAPWRPAPRDPLPTVVAGLAAGLRHLEQEVVRLHAAITVLEQAQKAATGRLEASLQEHTSRSKARPGPLDPAVAASPVTSEAEHARRE